MDKLVNLLNEFEESKEKHIWTEDELSYKPQRAIYAFSKLYGFIERLVKHDKIDREKVIEEIGGCIKISGLGPHYTFYSALLMILAVSDNPINDLISYLR